ncbi:uncharacterized protein LOC133823680 [Humulus lupulus]|uniref:uncharacterized protein LOC133823680 n=1 Tax=Humulus lupulus TaxID=3486 RepID=UPI002B40F356|nr:uncharacterized protein LOC133823680 [Humulus lupulus]
MTGLSKLGATLIVVFVVCFMVLIADLVYVIWRRRRFQRRSISTGVSVTSGDSTYSLSSKELLYFFCWTNRSRIEPNEANNNRSSPNNQTLTAPEIDDLLKLQGLYGQSRLLFTIKEEDFEAERPEENKEGTITSTAEADHDDQGFVVSTLTGDADAVSITVDEVTPFSTPCASPPYFTPSPSPSREELKQFYSHENIGRVFLSGDQGREEEVPQFVSLDIIGV